MARNPAPSHVRHVLPTSEANHVTSAPPFFQRLGRVSPGKSTLVEVEQALTNAVEPLQEVAEVLHTLPEAPVVVEAEVLVEASVELVEEAVAEVQAEPEAAVAEPEVVKQDWDPNMRKSALVAKAEAAGITVDPMDTKAQIIKKLEAL